MLSTLVTSLWLITPGFDTLLCAVMLYKNRWKVFPAFITMIVVDAISGLALFLINPHGHGQLYRHAFNLSSVLSFVTQLAVLVEIASNVLRQPDHWNASALRRLWIFGFGGALFAALTTWIVSSGKVFSWSLVTDDMQVFSSLVLCETVIAISLAAGQLGLPIKSHVLAIGQGFAAWSLLTASMYGIESFVDVHGPVYQKLEVARALLYPLTVLYWTVSLWYEEPARRPISPAMRKYIVAIHEQVHYDLGKVGR